ncbi:MAG: hypothetical protein IJT25_02490 [Clostridia bacterium]|nr:hypothetical protein [Clostridia bacterium]
MLIGRISFNLKNGFIVENQINNLPKDDIKHPHLMNLFAKQVVCHVEVDKLKMFYNFGISTNAEATANTTGTIYVLSSIISGYVLSANPMARITESFVPTFNENSLETTIVVSFKINILNIIISYFEAKKKYKIKFKGAK